MEVQILSLAQNVKVSPISEGTNTVRSSSIGKADFYYTMKLRAKIGIYLITFIALLYLFFYHLDYTALMSYDEAWYADITRNLVALKNPLLLTFNGAPYTDHPPFGFMMMAIPTILFGSNEFSARCISALCGALSIILLFLIGKKLKNALVGISSSAILLSSMWFMIRARSGNLDIPFLFLSLTTFYFLIHTKTNVRYFYFASLSCALLLLTKSFVGLGFLPLFLYYVFSTRAILTRKNLLTMSLILLICLGPWYMYNLFTQSGFLHHHILDIAFRGKGIMVSLESIKKTLFYLQVGIGKWYKLFFISVILALLLYLRTPQERKKINPIGLYLTGFLLPFFFSPRTEVWHLIPSFPAIALIISYAFYAIGNTLHTFLPYVTTAGIILLAGFQFTQFSNLIYFPTPQYSAEKNIAQKASRYTNLYLMDTFYPTAVYYSQKKVVPLSFEDNSFQKMVMLLKKGKSTFIINKNTLSELQQNDISFSITDKNERYFIIQ